MSATRTSGAWLTSGPTLAPEMGLVGLTAGRALANRWPPRRIVLAVVLVASAITGAGALGWVLAQMGAAVTTTVLGLGASVIVYLVLEELL